ncbi:MAG: hypothetical protein ACJAT1_002385 [Marivirga sp.]|jgi:hypothetical protein
MGDIMNVENYMVIWKHFDQKSETGIHLKANQDFSLPYFIEGEEKVMFQAKEPLNLNPLHLIKGLLVGYFDKPPGIDTSFANQHAVDIITEQLVTFKTDSLENFIHDLSNVLRDAHGDTVSLQSLMAGVELLTESSAIKYDCCIDLINCIDNDALEDRLAAVQQLKLLLSKIDVKQLNPALVNDYHKMIEIANKF